MKIRAEAFGAEIDATDSITRTMMSGDWHILVKFKNEDNKTRTECILSLEEAEILGGQLKEALSRIEEVKLKLQ